MSLVAIEERDQEFGRYTGDVDIGALLALWAG